MRMAEKSSAGLLAGFFSSSFNAAWRLSAFQSDSGIFRACGEASMSISESPSSRRRFFENLLPVIISRSIVGFSKK